VLTGLLWLVAACFYWAGALFLMFALAIVHGDCWLDDDASPSAIRACTNQKQMILGIALVVALATYTGLVWVVARRWKRPVA